MAEVAGVMATRAARRQTVAMVTQREDSPDLQSA